ncbi:MAG TPA: lipopolysaccharide assembly protein LapA domain-containing protein [Nocardioides sp.]|jgi:uncharacterized integral membrane protein|uniref:lipopolysaccharide assembly protein LapA domain-containing protein n=1 Tax=Nocardioides sp. TaxID=35761 RepID=UPI002C05529F|nr:lipopolysaccharide assembly protein LapA domain-containing protein [Nocardioides sp.]HTW17156.1 lipopolysaccharide assembly protein LapA domain-containing protein [Nocardioides sp.]
MSEPTDPVSTEPGTAGPETPADAPPGRDPLRGSRTSGVWLAVVAAAVLLVLLVVFIVQNTQSVQVSYFGWNGSAPLAAALLIAAAAGMVIAILAATLRMLQVRRRVRRDRR